MIKFSYEVRINRADNGIIVNVGCKTLVFKETEIGEFLADLGTLINHGEQELRPKYFPEELISKRTYLEKYSEEAKCCTPDMPESSN